MTVTFSYRPAVTVGLPFGRRRARLDSNLVLEFQNTVRRQRNAEIIKMYEAYLKDNGMEEMRLSRATYWRILKTCAASRLKSLHCVDYFISDATEVITDLVYSVFQAFEKIEQLVTEYADRGYFEADWSTGLLSRFKECRVYMQTDFKIHIKEVSRIADHCATHALSDPNEELLQSSCSKLDEKQRHVHERLTRYLFSLF